MFDFRDETGSEERFRAREHVTPVIKRLWVDQAMGLLPTRFWDVPGGAVVYCKVCHKTHGAQPGETPCGGDGSWIPDV